MLKTASLLTSFTLLLQASSNSPETEPMPNFLIAPRGALTWPPAPAPPCPPSQQPHSSTSSWADPTSLSQTRERKRGFGVVVFLDSIWLSTKIKICILNCLLSCPREEGSARIA